MCRYFSTTQRNISRVTLGPLPLVQIVVEAGAIALVREMALVGPRDRFTIPRVDFVYQGGVPTVSLPSAALLLRVPFRYRRMSVGFRRKTAAIVSALRPCAASSTMRAEILPIGTLQLR